MTPYISLYLPNPSPNPSPTPNPNPNPAQVRHYAGDVVYHTAKVVEQTTKAAEVSWLEKNNDTLDSGWLQQMVDSSVSTQHGARST